MSKYHISTTETIDLTLNQTIEANSKEEAVEKVQQMMDEGSLSWDDFDEEAQGTSGFSARTWDCSEESGAK